MGYLRDLVIDVTPSAIGGKKEISAMRLHHAMTWLSRTWPTSSPWERVGVQDARISISDSLLRGESFPKDALETRVTVPDGALYAQP